MPRYMQMVEGDEGWTPWIAPAADYRMGCCDCGLVHDLQFRIADGIIQFRATRNMRATAAKRHWRKRKGRSDGRC